MLKKGIIVAVAACALAALMVPAAATALWTKDHQVLQESGQLITTGQASFHGESGAVECQVKSAMQMLAGTTTGQVTSSDVDLAEAGSTTTQKCSVDSTLEFMGCTDVASVTSGGFPWTGHATSTQTLVVTTGTVQHHLHGGIFCPKTIQITPGTIQTTMSSSNTWTTGTSVGVLQFHSNQGSGQVEITGHGSLGGGTYGVE